MAARTRPHEFPDGNARHRDFRAPVALVGLLLMAASPAGTPSPAGSPSAVARAMVLTELGTFAQVYSASASGYNSCQFKLSYLGAQEKRTTSLAGVSTLRAGGFQRASFLPFQYHGFYGNDAHFGDTLVVSPAEIKAFMDAILVRPAMQDTTGPAQPHVSLMVMIGSEPSTICWEHCTAMTAESDTLFRLLHDALLGSADQATVDQFRHHMVGVRQ